MLPNGRWRIPAMNPARVMSGAFPDGITRFRPRSGAAAAKSQNSRYPYGQTRALPLSSTTCSAKTSPSTILRHRPLVTRSCAVLLDKILSYLILSYRCSYLLRFPPPFSSHGCPSHPARRDLRQHVGPTLRTAVRALLRATVAAAAHRTAAAALLWTKSSGVRGRRSSLA